MPFLSLPDADLYYEVNGSGPALIFAHGLGGNHISWWQQVPYFRERYTCVTFAHRGFAPSRDASGSGPQAFAGDLAALIDHLGYADVRLVAQSMGGWTCTAYAMEHAARVRALVLADTVGTLAHADVAQHFGRGSGGAELFERGIHPAAGERMAKEQPAMHFLYREIDALSSGIDKLAVRAMLAQMRNTPVEAFAALGIPLLCIAGDEDVVIPRGAVAALAALVPGARFAGVPEAGHSVYFERPQIFNQLVGEFLSAVEGGAA
jgi:3-oxoadipate enol-lactonase